MLLLKSRESTTSTSTIRKLASQGQNPEFGSQELQELRRERPFAGSDE
jgi:hypothetical protein